MEEGVSVLHGPEIKLLREIPVEEFPDIFEKLCSASRSSSFKLYSHDGRNGIEFSNWPHKRETMRKIFVFPEGHCKWEYSAKTSGFVLRHDVNPKRGTAELWCIGNAPAWTYEDTSMFEQALQDHGFTTAYSRRSASPFKELPS